MANVIMRKPHGGRGTRGNGVTHPHDLVTSTRLITGPEDLDLLTVIIQDPTLERSFGLREDWAVTGS